MGPIGKRAATVVVAAAVTATLSGVPAAGAATAGAARAAARSARTLDITAQGVTYTLSASTVRAGLVTFRLHNADQAGMQNAQVARLADGVTREQFLTALHSSQPQSAYSLVTFEGGPNATAPGDVRTSTGDLRPGHYVVLSWIRDTNGVVKALEGMIGWFDAVGPAGPRRPSHVDGTFTSFDFGYTLPKVVRRHGVYRFRNVSGDYHELSFVRLAPGKTFADFQQWVASGFTTPQPGVAEGGVSSIGADTRAWVRFDMPAGTYVAACWVTDYATGARHAAEGEMASFTVR